MKLVAVKFWDWLIVSLLFITGCFLLYSYFFSPDLQFEIYTLYHDYALGPILGLLMVSSVIFRLVNYYNSTSDKFVDFDSGDGSVGISTKAMKDYIDRVAYEFAAVKNVSTKVISNRNGVNFLLKVKIIAGSNIPELSQMMQQRIRESVNDSLGIENINSVSINVQEILTEDIENKKIDEDIDLNQ